MAGFQDVLKAIGFTAGAVTGGPSQIKVVAGAVSAQGKINSYLQSVGKSIGGLVGPNLFNKIASGAQVTGDAETKSFVESQVLTGSTKTALNIAFLSVLGLLGYFLYKRRI